MQNLTNVEFATFAIKVDTISVLQTSQATELALFKKATANKVLSVVAFTCASSLSCAAFDDSGDGVNALHHSILERHWIGHDLQRAWRVPLC
jgi:hypothetical protein